MFQYALGKALAHRHQTELLLDLHKYNTPGNYRTFELNIFRIQGAVATLKQVPKSVRVPEGLIRRQAHKLYLMLQKPDSVNIVTERYFHFDQTILNTPDNTYLEGYWQSEKYFKEIEPIIRREFTFKSPPKGRNLELARQIENQ
jgi:hypothetical protein